MPFGVSFENFDPEIHVWARYVKRLRHFLLATKVEETLLLSTTFTLLGDKTYATLCDLFAPEDPDTKTLDQVLQKLSEHFSPRIMIPVERFHFSQRKQLKDETIAEYVLELRKLSKNCKYGTGLDDRLCEQFVYGLADQEMRTRLLLEELLPLDIAIKIASGIEAAKLGASTFIPTPKEQDFINKVQEKPLRSKASNSYKPCYRCGEETHLSENCRFKHVLCNHCGKTGHIAKVCRSSANSRLSKNNPKTSSSTKRQDRQPPSYSTVSTVTTSKDDIDQGTKFLVANSPLATENLILASRKKK